MTLGSFWGPLKRLWGSLGHTWGTSGKVLGAYLGEVPKDDLTNFRKSVTGAVKRRPRESKRAPDGRQNGAERLSIRPQRPLKRLKKVIKLTLSAALFFVHAVSILVARLGIN